MEDGELAVTEPAKLEPSFSVTVACGPLVAGAVEVVAAGSGFLLHPLNTTNPTAAALTKILRICLF